MKKHELNALASRRAMIQTDSDSDTEDNFFDSDNEQDTTSSHLDTLDKKTEIPPILSSILYKSKTSSTRDITPKLEYLGDDYIAECVKDLLKGDVYNAGGYDVITGVILEYLDDSGF